MFEDLRAFIDAIVITIRLKLGTTQMVDCSKCGKKVVLEHLTIPFKSTGERMCPYCAIEGIHRNVSSILDYAKSQEGKHKLGEL
jgi:uncharacterized Zn-finger protein